MVKLMETSNINSSEGNHMIKKVGLVLFLLMIIGFAEMYVDIQKEDKVETSMEVEMPSEMDSLVLLIFELAEKGQALNVPFIVGETDIQQLHEMWGDSDETSDLSMDTYESYLSKKATIGHHSGIIFDIRSNAKAVQKIRLSNISEIAGEADEIRNYKDGEVNQMIFVYEITPTYQLKWVLPRPTDNEPDPTVHHISVSTHLKETVDEEISAITGMSLEEKIGQMIFAGIEGVELSEETKQLISTDKVGGIIFFKDNLKKPDQTVELLNALKAESKNEKFPLFLGVDQEGGRVTRLPGLIDLPTNEEIGKQQNENSSYNIGSLLGRELNAFGFNMNFAPVLDVNSNRKNPVIGDRSFGGDAETVSKLGIQTMKGIQSENVIAVVKHFPGHGDTAVDSHIELPIIPKTMDDLNKLELIPFKEAIVRGADVVMVAHILLPEIDPNLPSSMSYEIITGILREQLQFEGVIMTDDLTMNAITGNYEIGRAAVEAVKAGNDIVLIAHDYANVNQVIEAITKAVKVGEISEERIDASVNRILLLKKNYKMSNEQVNGVNLKEINNLIEQTLGR